MPSMLCAPPGFSASSARRSGARALAIVGFAALACSDAPIQTTGAPAEGVESPAMGSNAPPAGEARDADSADADPREAADSRGAQLSEGSAPDESAGESEGEAAQQGEAVDEGAPAVAPITEPPFEPTEPEANGETAVPATEGDPPAEEPGPGQDPDEDPAPEVDPNRLAGIYLVGDSTMQDYSVRADYLTNYYPQAGWGEMLQGLLTPDVLPTIAQVIPAGRVQVINWARGGRSTRSFWEEGR